ncbi:MAG TPA: hypothetical protein VJ276_05660 [Thermoanaerobaculia bacterium]|nr:hypothetical protein [Thermoanaerobaculia bacterium]
MPGARERARPAGGAKANKALTSLLEKETASVAGKAGAKLAGGVVTIAIDLAIADKLNAQDDRALMKIEMDALKKHFGGRTVDKLSDEEREQYFEMVNEQSAAPPKGTGP